MPISQKPALESSSLAIVRNVPTIRGINCSRRSISEFSSWQADTCATLLLPTLSHSDIRQEHVSLSQSETCLWRNSETKPIKDEGLSILGPNAQPLSERQIKRRMPLLILEMKEQHEGLFPKQMLAEYPLTSSRNVWPPPTGDLDTPALQTGWNTEGKPQQLHICQQLLYVKTLGGNLQQKYSQLFWGLPSLHSESLVANVLVSGSCLPLESSFVLFNGICKHLIVQEQDKELPAYPKTHPLGNPSVHFQHLPPTQSQSHSLHVSQIQPQTHLQPSLPILPSTSVPEIRACGVCFHRPQNETKSDLSHKFQHLERHLLKKQQESLWGLAHVFQRSQEAFCPPAPSLPLVSQSSQACAPVSIISGHFPVNTEPQEKLVLHVPKKLVPHECLHICREQESLALMQPLCRLIETSQQNCRHTHSQCSGFKDQSSTDLEEFELNYSGIILDRSSSKFPLKKGLGNSFGHSLVKGSSRVSENYVANSLGTISEETQGDWVCHSRKDLGNKSLNISQESIDEEQMKWSLNLHLFKKFWQISECKIPVSVCRSWLADESMLPLSDNMENTNVAPSAGRKCCQINPLKLTFLDPDTRHMLEDHIIQFRVSQKWGLPLKVRESIRFYTLREAKSWPLPQFDIPSSVTSTSGINSKVKVSKPLGRNPQALQGDSELTNSIPILDCLQTTTSPVGKEEQEAPKQSLSNISHALVDDFQTTEDGKQSFMTPKYSIIDKMNQNKTVQYPTIPNRHSELPTNQAGVGHESRDNKLVSPSDRVETLQGKNLEENLEHFSMANVSREIFKAEELLALESQSRDILTTKELENYQMINVDTNKAETTFTTVVPPLSRMSVPQDPELSYLQKPLVSELKFKLEGQEHSQVQSYSTNTSLTSDSMDSTSFLMHAQSVPWGYIEVSQGLNVHAECKSISMEQRQKSWTSKYVFGKWDDENFSPTAGRVNLQRPRAGQYRKEDLGLGTSKARTKSYPIQVKKSETRESNSDQYLSQKEESPQENFFRKKMRQFFQWIHSKKQDSLLQKAKFVLASVQNQDSGESMNCGDSEAQELMAAIGNMLEEKLGCRQGLQQTAAPHATEGRSSNNRILTSPEQREVSNTNPGSQKAVPVSQSSPTHDKQIRDRNIYPQKLKRFKDQLLSYSPSPSPREPVSHEDPSTMHQICQVPQATLLNVEGTVLRDLSLLFRQKMLLQHFQGGKCPPIE
ncbi:PREDICTED: spermatogenesis-associated protein 31D1-like [Chrysochloris asiatica]|uniref:Spermatogenesis-associated protein 31D1-like n=1 Tax=Chrysochloris asiatica TaxID=185453 RepID=A0A9B0T3U3_CHRAS|nr:PREDICTED: spermatogenesis-associated protein 31D1-like [Chrysochloris asiatica]